MHKQKPLPGDIFTDEDLIALPIAVRLTAIGLRMHADDQGRESTTPWRVKSAIWPGNPEVTEDDLIEHLLLLDAAGYVGIYSVGDRTYYQVRDWPAPSHPAPSQHPAPPADLFQRAAGISPEARSAWEREREGERGWESAPESPAGVPPSPFCKVHQPNGTRQACRHCGTARLAHEQYLHESRQRTGDE
jgi:hypothetical protein